ncbi:hypothetical protein C1M53_14580 [Mesorhizobium sp. Pch-S]|jgi:hypothetical protein|nr:hypothetical protein C1M53_14580 [Mesorhizobium sp. Pch-S]
MRFVQPLTAGLRPAQKAAMSKLLALIILAMMAIQVIKPLGLPGLRRRRDCWKLAVAALAAISLTALLGHQW